MEAKAVAKRNIKLSEISSHFSALFSSSWMVGVDEIQVRVVRKVWLMALSGIFDEQIDYALNQIATDNTPYQKFPPNPQEFRALCKCFKMPEPEKPLQIAHVLSPEEIAEKRARWDQHSRDMREMMRVNTIKLNEEKRLRELELKKKEDEYYDNLRRVEDELIAAAKARDLVRDPKINDDIPHQNRGEGNGSTNT